VLDHMALHSHAKGAAAFADLDKTLALARRPNIAIKASALPKFADDEYPYRMVQPYLWRAYSAFGPDRMFWGTDLTRLPCSYRQAVTMFTEEIRWLTDSDKERIMGRGLCEWLGWPIAQSRKSETSKDGLAT
jgi:predicted TIM-barrel fold metal-dependent hydrolase